MQMNRKEFLEFVADTDLNKVVALDVSTFSISMNCQIGGRIEKASATRMIINTGISCNYTIDMHITSYLAADIYLVKKGKNGSEFADHHFNFNLKESFGDILVAITDKIEKNGGILSKKFPPKRLSKCLSHSIIRVTDKGEDTFEEYYDVWGGMYGNPYAHISRSTYTPKEKKFYFKEQNYTANESK